MAENLKVETALRISKPAPVVYEAIVNPEEMSGYFISSGSGRLDAGAPVIWKWDDVGAELTITPQELEANRRVCFLWSASGAEARVEIRLEADGDNATTVKVQEASWAPDAEGIARCMGQTQGWVHMLCCLKAHVEHGINLRA